MADENKVPVISNQTLRDVNTFRGVVLQSIVTINLPTGKHSAKIVSEASFRSFVAGQNSKNAGKEYGVLEVTVKTEPTKGTEGVTLKARIDKTFAGFVGQVVSIDVTESESNGTTYKNAVVL